MNNKLIADIEKHNDRMDLLREVFPQIEYLVDHGDIFTKEDSIFAISKIKEYLISLNEELKNGRLKTQQLKRTLRKECTHDVLIKHFSYPCYDCLICRESFLLEDINFNAILVECLEDMLYNDIYNDSLDIINEIAMKDEDVFSVFENRLYNIDRLKNKNILVYRRSR